MNPESTDAKMYLKFVESEQAGGEDLTDLGED